MSSERASGLLLGFNAVGVGVAVFNAVNFTLAGRWIWLVVSVIGGALSLFAVAYAIATWPRVPDEEPVAGEMESRRRQ